MLSFHEHLATQLGLIHELEQLAHTKKERKTINTAEKKEKEEPKKQ